jgi:hypothetical protein
MRPAQLCDSGAIHATKVQHEPQSRRSRAPHQPQLAPNVKVIAHTSRHGILLLGLAMVLVALIYSTGLSGGWIFDDYPNIVDNQGVQPSEASIPALVRAAMSSPASEFKRPLASLSFAANYLASGLQP